MLSEGTPINLPYFPPRSPTLKYEWKTPALRNRPYTAIVRHTSPSSYDYCQIYLSGYQVLDRPPHYKYLLVFVRGGKVQRLESTVRYKSALRAMESAEALVDSLLKL